MEGDSLLPSFLPSFLPSDDNVTDGDEGPRERDPQVRARAQVECFGFIASTMAWQPPGGQEERRKRTITLAPKKNIPVFLP